MRARLVKHKEWTPTAPVSHQKRSLQNATNAINTQRECCKINDQVLCPPAHNGLVAGSSPAGPTNEISDLSILIFSTPPEILTGSETISAQITKSSQWHLRQAGRARRPACRSCRQWKVSTHDVCFCSMIGHSLATSAVPKCAKPGRTQGEQISSEMRSRADIETASRRSVSQKATQHGRVGSRVRPLSRI